MAFPTSLDSLTEVISATTLEDASGFEHDLVHNAANAAINDLEAKVGIDSSAVTTSHDYLIQHGIVPKDAAWQGDISPAQLTANTDNWNPTGLSTASVIRLSTDASRNLTGIAGGADGRVLVLLNKGSFDLVLKHDVTSTTGNRFYLPGSTDMTLGANQGVVLWYDSTDSRWRPATGSGSGGGGSDGSDHDILDHADANTSPSPTDGDVLTWDSTPGEWIAAAPSGGSASEVTPWTQVLDEDGTSFAAWASSSGTWSSDGTVIKQTDTGASFRRAYVNAKQETAVVIFEAEVQLRSSGTDRIGGIWVGSDGGSGGGMCLRINEGTDVANIEIDATSNRVSLSTTIAVNTWYKLRIVCAGDHFTGYIDDVIVGTAGNSAQTISDASYVGLVSYQAEVWYRNVKSWKLADVDQRAPINVKEGGTLVSSVIDTLDFGAGFDVSESPSGEANITLDLSEVAVPKARPKNATKTYHTLPGVAVTAYTNGTGVPAGPNVIVYQPIYVEAAMIVDRLAIDITTLESGKKVRIGLFAADEDWQPTGAALIDSGDISTTTAGYKTYDPSPAVTLAAGRYLLAYNTDSVTTWRFAFYDGNVPGASALDPATGTGFNRLWTVAQTYGALTAAAWTAVGTNTNSPTMRYPVTLRISDPSP